jgi:hypothetical protein
MNKGHEARDMREIENGLGNRADDGRREGL